MLKRAVTLLAVSLFTLSLSISALADEVMGTISKVGDEGREITVKTKDGKETNVKISGSRTKIDGVKGRSDLKEGQKVSVEHDKGEAKTVKVTK
jgi:CRISPR/Cas system-associated exonuclease Cas4 (RecB family)